MKALAGYQGKHGGKVTMRTGEVLLTSGEKSDPRVSLITDEGKGADGERMADGPVRAKKSL